MNVRKFSLVALVIVMLATMVFPALAADKTVTLTESDINSSYRVTNPRNRTISDVQVDLQPGQAVISATFTTRKTDPIPVSVTLVPSVSNGRVTWTASAAMANGQAVSVELLAQINASMSSSWRNYWKGKNPGKVTSISISDDSITWTKATK